MFGVDEILAAVPCGIVGVDSIIPDWLSDVGATPDFILQIVLIALMLVFLVSVTAWSVYKWLKASEEGDGGDGFEGSGCFALFAVALTTLFILVLFSEVGNATASFIIRIIAWAFWFGICGLVTWIGLVNWLELSREPWIWLFLVGLAVITTSILWLYHLEINHWTKKRLTLTYLPWVYIILGVVIVMILYRMWIHSDAFFPIVGMALGVSLIVLGMVGVSDPRAVPVAQSILNTWVWTKDLFRYGGALIVGLLLFGVFIRATLHELTDPTGTRGGVLIGGLVTLLAAACVVVQLLFTIHFLTS